MKVIAILAVILCPLLTAEGKTPPKLVPAASVAARRESDGPFRLCGRITAAAEDSFVLTDASGSCWISACGIEDSWRCGDTVRFRAYLKQHTIASPDGSVYASDLETLAHGTGRQDYREVGIGDLSSGQLDLKPVSVRGTVTDVFTDELDPKYSFMTLETDGDMVILTFRTPYGGIGNLLRFVDREVRACGVCVPGHCGYRRFVTRSIYTDPRSGISEQDRAGSDAATGLPHRTSITGTVLAYAGPKSFYLRADDDKRIKVYLGADATPPPCRTTVTVRGFVRRNIFFESLSNATVERTAVPTDFDDIPVRTTARDLLYDASGNRMLAIQLEGRPVRIVGRVETHSEARTPETRISMDCDGISVPVRVGTLAPPPIGSEVEISGICSITSESDGNPYGFVRLTGFTLLTRGPEDIVILKNPPWWTPTKMLAVIAALVLLVVAVLIWNKALRTLAERRGRELMDEQLGRVAADLKVNERTRLAVELHDALSQNLTGVSLQLDAVKRFADEDRGKMARHLDMAMRTLKSCRDELRNCLWDLRNRALEETDMNEAIRRTASPFVGDATLLIRFNVPRDQISDNTAHALMRIIRELATNAVRHGAAKTIRIAGALENGRLLFSVSDDGGGFNPQRHPGVDEGHFGLDGIRERIENLGGSMEIESAPDKGSTIRISMTA